MHRATLEALVESMNCKISLIQELDKQILDLTDTTELEAVIIEADDYAEESYSHIHGIRAILRLRGNPSKHTTHPADETLTPRRKVNLPKLQLPKFDGNALKWIPFFMLSRR